jgi:hypothetical protein
VLFVTVLRRIAAAFAGSGLGNVHSPVLPPPPCASTYCFVAAPSGDSGSAESTSRPDIVSPALLTGVYPRALVTSPDRRVTVPVRELKLVTPAAKPMMLST